MERQATSNGRPRPACVGMEEAAGIFGWPNYYMPFLLRAGHLKPLGKPAPNARKWFATVEIERMSCDPDWLDKANHNGQQLTTNEGQTSPVCPESAIETAGV